MGKNIPPVTVGTCRWCNEPIHWDKFGVVWVHDGLHPAEPYRDGEERVEQATQAPGERR